MNWTMPAGGGGDLDRERDDDRAFNIDVLVGLSLAA
jgi:hypothetical protein